MILWYAGLAPAVTLAVFSDPRLDYRLVVAGALLPDLLDAPWRGAGPFHSLVAAVGVLFAVVLATSRRRAARRRLLALPIGLLLHLALDAMWGEPEVFWWPLLGLGALGDVPLPALDRALALVAVQEAVGLVALVWWTSRVKALREAAC